MRVPSELVGFIIGRNGENINNIQSLCDVRLQFHHGTTDINDDDIIFITVQISPTLHTD